MIKNKLNLISYFPFIGWIFILGFNSRDKFAVKHAKQGFILSVVMISVLTTLVFASIFIPDNNRTLKLVIVIMIYLIYLVYFSLCIIGTLMIKKENDYEFPVIKRFTDKIDL